MTPALPSTKTSWRLIFSPSHPMSPSTPHSQRWSCSFQSSPLLITGVVCVMTQLPTKLLLGLTAFYVSIASTAISFSAGHFIILREKLKSAAFPAYPVICLVVIFVSIIEFPLYFQLAWATFKRVPQRKHSFIGGYF